MAARIFPIAFQYEVGIIIFVVNKTDVCHATLALMVLKTLEPPKEGLA